MSLDVVREGDTCWKLSAVSENAVLVDADSYYSAFCRAALLAKHYIYITGWQFDSQARLLRAPAEAPPPHPIELLPFLNHLCERTPELQIFITAWDYSLVYAFEREWMQKLRFDFQSHERVHFEFLNHPEGGGCHHQKMAIIDGEIAFLGGLDLCDSRWDTREHVKRDSRRVDVHGNAYKPFHDIQVALRGPVVGALTELFAEGWRRAAKGQCALPQPLAPEHAPAFELGRLTAGSGIPLHARRVGVSRTELVAVDGPVVCEVQSLLERAIQRAERLIYIENQYFTSRAVAEALSKRLGDTSRSKLQLVLMMPDGADSPKEDFVLGDRQRTIRRLVAEVAKRHGHEFRLLMSSEAGSEKDVPATFIHSKLMIVDDELLTIGSANLTNRSLRLDRELNVVYETRLESAEGAERLRADIRALRASLLAEHAGGQSPEAFLEIDGLVARIDAVCDDAGSKLRCQALPDAEGDSPLLIALFDPSTPLDWSTFDDVLEKAFDKDEGLLRRSAKRAGQRLGVVDIE